MIHFYVYRKSTGEILRTGTFAVDEDIKRQAMGADEEIAEGIADHRRHRVVDGQLALYTPPQPSAEHIWHEPSGQWHLDPNSETSRKPTYRMAIAALESQQHRALRELALAPDSADARARVQQIDAQIAALRAKL